MWRKRPGSNSPELNTSSCPGIEAIIFYRSTNGAGFLMVICCDVSPSSQNLNWLPYQEADLPRTFTDNLDEVTNFSREEISTMW
ncbi:MAG: hypothetical protein R3B47_07285 [Bacteroidia bacterium]